jgi:hypothetical protein
MKHSKAEFELEHVLKEARTMGRMRVSGHVSLISTKGEKRSIGTCVNLSMSGLKLVPLANFTAAPDSELVLEITPASEHRLAPFRVLARVIWSTSKEAGFRFIFLPEELSKKLSAFFFRALKEV